MLCIQGLFLLLIFAADGILSARIGSDVRDKRYSEILKIY